MIGGRPGLWFITAHSEALPISSAATGRRIATIISFSCISSNSGDLQLKLDGVDFAAAGPVVFFTPPSVPHAFRIDPKATGHVVTIHQSMVRQIFDADPSLPSANLAAPFCLPLEGAEGRHEARNLSRLFGILRREVETHCLGEVSAVAALSCLILVALFRLSHAPAVAAAPRQHDLRSFRKFNDLVEQNFTRHWTIPDYVAALNMTETRLHDLCRRVAGKSPKSIAHERLLLEARRLLTFSQFPVNEIAGALGFDDVGYFCRFFKRQLGVTPSNFRRSSPTPAIRRPAAEASRGHP